MRHRPSRVLNVLATRRHSLPQLHPVCHLRSRHHPRRRAISATVAAAAAPYHSSLRPQCIQVAADTIHYSRAVPMDFADSLVLCHELCRWRTCLRTAFVSAIWICAALSASALSIRILCQLVPALLFVSLSPPHSPPALSHTVPRAVPRTGSSAVYSVQYLYVSLFSSPPPLVVVFRPLAFFV